MGSEVVQLNGKPSLGSQKVLKAAGAMGAATFISRIMGLVREQVFAYLFGAGHLTDAFNVAFRIPNLLRDLFAEGAMSGALVPVFTRVRHQEGDRRAWRVAGLVFRVLFVVVGVLSLLGIVFAPELVGIYAGQYRATEGKFEVTVLMTRVMFLFFPLVALAAAYMGVLNACGKFFLPAFASALFNITSVLTGVAGVFLLPHWGYSPIVGMAVGVVLGGAVQAFCQLPALYRVGYRWEPAAAGAPSWRRDPALRSMLTLMVPGLVGLGATQINVLINTMLATSQPGNAVSWLNYAFRLMQFPIGIFGVSLASATLPEVSRLWVAEDAKGVAATLDRSLRQAFAINLPASAGLAFLGVPIVELLFQYGKFSALDSARTAAALAAYAIGLTAYSVVKVLVPACYALGKTRVAVISSVATIGVTVCLNLVLIGPFGFVGLALGTSFAAVLNSLFLLFSLRRVLADGGAMLSVWGLARSFGLHALVAVGMGLVCRTSAAALQGWIPGEGSGIRAARILILVIEGLALTLILGRLLRLKETSETFGLIFNKLVNKLKKKLSPSGN